MATSSDTFGTIADVEQNVSRGPFTDTSQPTQDQVLAIMISRSAQVESALRSKGEPYTVPSGGSPFPASPTDFERSLKTLCDDAVESGAAAQALIVSTTSEAGDVAETAKYWEDQFDAGLKAISDLCDAPSTSGNRSTVEYSSLPTDGVTPRTDW